MKALTLLLHGLCSTPEELMPVQTALRTAGHVVKPLLVPGYSYNPLLQKQDAAPHKHWVHSVAQSIEQLRTPGQNVVLVGLSAGATLALAVALEHPGLVDGLVLMSTPLRYDGWATPWYHFLMPLALYTPVGRFWQYKEAPPYGVKNLRVRRWIERELALRRISRAGAAVIGVPHLREHDRLRRRVLRRMSRLACPPVLVLHADEDEVAGPSNAVLLERQLRTPSFRKVMLPDSHHMITIDNDRPQVVRETVQFVAAVAAAVPSPQPRPAFGVFTHEPVHI